MAASKGTTDRATSKIWMWVVVAFVVQIFVWVGLFLLAAHHPVEEVPIHDGRHETQRAPARPEPIRAR